MSRRSLHALAVGVAAAPLVVGCQRAPTPPGTAPSSAGSVAAAQQVMDGIARAVMARDRNAFAALLDRVDDRFAHRAGLLWDNLVALPLDTLAFTVSASSTPSSSISSLTWSLTDEDRPARATVGLRFSGTGDDTRWSGIDDASARSSATAVPVWWLARVDVDETTTAGTHVTLEAAQGAAHPAGTTWVALARHAMTAAARHGPDAPPGRIVIQVPGDQSTFARTVGRPPGSIDDLAALTIGLGPDPVTAPATVVINPSVLRRLDPSAYGFVLTHEAVHALWRSPAASAPMWLEEGYADAVAYLAYPSLAKAADRDLRADVGANGAPRMFPPDEDFVPDADDLDATYTRAWSACAFIAERWGWPALTAVVAQVSKDQHARWWVRLGRDSAAAVEHDWAAWLSERA